MGRGRAKAKQTKVARELKYSSPETDFEALQRELAARNNNSEEQSKDSPEYDDYEDWASRKRPPRS